MSRMTPKGAFTQMKKEAKFLGKSVLEVLQMCEENPMTFNEKSRQATKLLLKEMRRKGL